MSIVRDTRIEELKRIEHLLYGINYEVWFNLYGPADPELALTDTLKRLISKDCEVSGLVPSTPNEAMSEIMDMVLYKGDTGSGPLEFESKKSEISELMSKVFSSIGIEDAEMVVEFDLKKVILLIQYFGILPMTSIQKASAGYLSVQAVTSPNKSKHADLLKLSLFCTKKAANFTKPVFEALKI